MTVFAIRYIEYNLKARFTRGIETCKGPIL